MLAMETAIRPEVMDAVGDLPAPMNIMAIALTPRPIGR
jgi:hypothetical protein